MKFAISNPVRVTSVKNITSKAGKELTFVTFANTSTFEVLECKLVLADGQSMDEIAEQRDYKALVDYDGTYGTVTLAPVSQASK